MNYTCNMYIEQNLSRFVTVEFENYFFLYLFIYFFFFFMERNYDAIVMAIWKIKRYLGLDNDWKLGTIWIYLSRNMFRIFLALCFAKLLFHISVFPNNRWFSASTKRQSDRSAILYYYFFFTILLEIPRNANYKFPFIENTFYLDPYLDPKRFRYVSIVVNLYSRDISQRCAALSTSVLTVENVADWIHY